MKDKNKKYYIFARDVNVHSSSMNSIHIKAGTPFVLIREETFAEDYKTISNIEKLEKYFTYGAVWDDYSHKIRYSPIEISEKIALKIMDEIDCEYRENKKWNENRKRRIARFLLNLFLWPFNLFYKIDCGEEISEYIMWQ